MKKIIFVSLIAFASVNAFAQTPIAVKDAAKHVNEKVTICDKIFGGKFLDEARITFLNMGADYPNSPLTLVIKGDDRKKFKTPEEAFKGKQVCVTGTIIMYKGKPEIEITEAEQIKFNDK